MHQVAWECSCTWTTSPHGCLAPSACARWPRRVTETAPPVLLLPLLLHVIHHRHLMIMMMRLFAFLALALFTHFQPCLSKRAPLAAPSRLTVARRSAFSSTRRLFTASAPCRTCSRTWPLCTMQPVGAPLAPHMSHLTRHTSHVTPHTSHLTPHTSHPTIHTPHLTPHISHLTPHTSHLTPHTSHLTPHLRLSFPPQLRVHGIPPPCFGVPVLLRPAQLAAHHNANLHLELPQRQLADPKHRVF
jgi:hypothetical protein